MSCVTPRGHWCDTVLNVLAPTRNKSYNTKDSFYDKLRVYIRSGSNIPQEHFVRRSQCQSRKKKYFQTDKWKRVYMKSQIVMELK
jgi:hypothetical protein